MRSIFISCAAAAALAAAAPAFAHPVQSADTAAGATVNQSAGDTYRGKPGQSGLDRTTVGLASAAQVQTPDTSTSRPSVSTSASAQADGHSSTAAQTLNPTSANGAPPLPPSANTGAAVNANANAAEMTIPTSWKGSPQQWSAHVTACSKAYKSYDAATDMYMSGGKSMMCKMSMPK